MLSQFFAFMSFALIINLIPGPAMVHCIVNGAKSGARAGLAASTGVEFGVFLYVLASATGLAALLIEAPTAYNIIRFCGIGFLFYMAWGFIPRQQTLKTKKENLPIPTSEKKSPFLQGLVINLLNPKIALVFLTLLPQFIKSADQNAKQVLFYGLAFNLSGLTVNSGAALFAARLQKTKALTKFTHTAFAWIPPIVLSGLALYSLTDFFLAS